MKIAYDSDCIGFEVQTIQKAYVVYDLDHKKNMNRVSNFLKLNNIVSCGRFAEFEYMNMDHVIESAMKKSKAIISSFDV